MIALALTGVVGDAVFLLITVAFFTVTMLLVQACARIVGPDDASTAANASTATNASAVSTASDRGGPSAQADSAALAATGGAGR